MLNIENLTKLNINSELLEDIAQSLSSKEIDLTICDNQTIQHYNYQFRKKNTATDVLSFPMESDFILSDDSMMPLGSIVISAEYITEKATKFGHSNNNELALLFIHGLLHLLGYDHEVDNGEMRQKEEAMIHLFHLPKSLIVRVEES